MAVVMPEVEGHPNRVDFRGVLTVVDMPSERAPHGSHGSRVLLTRAAAEKALPSLIGMALDYSPSFEGHDARRKVGVITRADIVGRNVEVGGYLYARDFPEIVREVRKCGKAQRKRPRPFDLGPQHCGISDAAHQATTLGASLASAAAEIRRLTAALRKREPGHGSSMILRAEAAFAGTGAGLGMSYEVTDVDVVDQRARVWILTKVMFTGAAILRKSRAAYEETWIELVE
jgi:hypothetical protein